MQDPLEDGKLELCRVLPVLDIVLPKTLVSPTVLEQFMPEILGINHGPRPGGHLQRRQMTQHAFRLIT